MLRRLQIHNYALIDQLDLTLENGFTIITGETGAGKSILLGALGLILGQRADTDALMDKTRKCMIEGDFDLRELKNSLLKEFFSANELDYADVTTIRREISAEGKSRSFVNDTPVNLSLLKELGQQLVDIHSQHETLDLNNGRFQLGVVDAAAAHTEALESYRNNFKKLTQLKQKLNELETSESQSKADLEYLRFQSEELSSAKLEGLNQLELEQELQSLTHAEEIRSGLQRSLFIINEGEQNVLSALNEAQQSIAGIVKYHAASEPLLERLKSSLIELKDISNELSHEVDSISTDPAKAEEISGRLNILYHLQQKHKVSSVNELISLQEQISDKLLSIDNLDETILKLKKELEDNTESLKKEAAAIAKSRAAAIPKVENAVNGLLSEVALPNATFKIEQELLGETTFTSDGTDRVRFLFSANKGMEPRDLSKVASGGEMSRLMLCIKAFMAGLTSLPTIIFDEIDTGISGETAAHVATVMQKIASGHQIIAITHLPQMAARGKQHLWVFKDIQNGMTYSRIRSLNWEERVDAIARMLSGTEATGAALANARELLMQN